MRVVKDEIDFSSYLLTIGDGTAQVRPEIGQDMIQILQEYLVDTMDELIDKVFPNIDEKHSDKYWVSRRAILTPKNDGVDKINELIMIKFPGKGRTYLSADSVAEEDLHNAYPTDFLNSITLSGMPPHSMTLKVGPPVILLRNLRGGPGGGLRNGMRLIVLNLGEKVMEVEIASGINKSICKYVGYVANISLGSLTSLNAIVMCYTSSAFQLCRCRRQSIPPADHILGCVLPGHTIRQIISRDIFCLVILPHQTIVNGNPSIHHNTRILIISIFLFIEIKI